MSLRFGHPPYTPPPLSLSLSHHICTWWVNLETGQMSYFALNMGTPSLYDVYIAWLYIIYCPTDNDYVGTMSLRHLFIMVHWFKPNS